MSDSFECAHYGEVFDKGWTDEEAAAEKDAEFPSHPIEDCAVVCDACYKKITAWAKENIS